MINGLRITIDGEVEPFQMDATDGRALPNAVGGYIEMVTSADGRLVFWVNENGKLDGLPFNGVATKLLWRFNPAFLGQDFLCGPVVLTGNSDVNGDVTSIPSDFNLVTE